MSPTKEDEIRAEVEEPKIQIKKKWKYGCFEEAQELLSDLLPENRMTNPRRAVADHL